MRKPSTGLRVTALTLFFAAWVLSSLGQQLSGTLTGTVTDQSNAVLPGAKITLTNDQSGSALTTETTTQGSLSIAGIMAGNYTIT
ncbi:MAG: carboxypeptidase regulatory-like domain-containing protein, partial [Bryobacterales bacterium]|nr:carboxypeptidase regulatory-like domain-containing protein [Bryobacterales bacterium]